MRRILVLLAVCFSLMACSTHKSAQKSTSPPSSKENRVSGDSTAVAAISTVVVINSETSLSEMVSTDPNYGYTEKKAIKVGGNLMNGPLNERKFLNALAGPNGERISYERKGSCCPFNTPNSSFGGMLDVYEITYPGLKKPILLYLNMYDPGGVLKLPAGFTMRK